MSKISSVVVVDGMGAVAALVRGVPEDEEEEEDDEEEQGNDKDAEENEDQGEGYSE
jgi:hypothetical protein